MQKFDLIVIGTGPAGEKGAVKAAYFGRKVAIIEKEKVYGGAETVTGTIPSKTLKETALFLTGKHEKGIYSIERNLEHSASVDDFMYRKNFVSQSTSQEIHDNLVRHGVTIFPGFASFEDAHTIKIKDETEELISGDYILIATGSYPFHPPTIPFDNKRIHDSDTILEIDRFPSSLCIVGAGVIGCEYATIFATMGTRVYLVNDKEHILPFVDHEVSKELVNRMQMSGIKIFFNNSVETIIPTSSEDEMISITLKKGEKLSVDMFLFAAGRNGNVQGLGLEKIGIKIGSREQIFVDEDYRTNIPHIFAAGDVIGFPALVSTSMDQGRIAVGKMFPMASSDNKLTSEFPYGIYTVPEVSMVGITEEEAIKCNVNYCVGKSRYTDLPRGKILGIKGGFLKLIFSRDDLRILGVHIVGRQATELIHYGVALVQDKKTLHHVIGQVFNFPTLHELYRYAAYDGLSTFTGHKVKP